MKTARSLQVRTANLESADALEELDLLYLAATRGDRDAIGAILIAFGPTLDIGLPGMDGYELARRLRRARDSNALKLVALTGYGLAADRERAFAAGFDEHLVKPVSLELVKRVIERLAATPAT